LEVRWKALALTSETRGVRLDWDVDADVGGLGHWDVDADVGGLGLWSKGACVGKEYPTAGWLWFCGKGGLGF